MNEGNDVISIIIPIYNGAKWINTCLEGIHNQKGLDKNFKLEICVCNDASTDETLKLLKTWKSTFESIGISMKVFSNSTGKPGGVGFAKNRAVNLSTGNYLCFQDIDDVMLPYRIIKQFETALKHPQDVIIGCKFKREPENSTPRYTKWANSLTQEQLNSQVFTSHGPTIIMPTWFLHKSVFEKCAEYQNVYRVGGFVEGDKGTPEDLIFFNKHLDLGGKVHRVEDVLLIYTFHAQQTTFSIHQDTIWALRLDRVQRVVLSSWPSFTIWNAGKQGRKFYHGLSEVNKAKVGAFCDVDRNKIGRKYAPFDAEKRTSRPGIDIVHFRAASPPFVICVKMDMTGGDFENHLKELHLREGADYVMFS